MSEITRVYQFRIYNAAGAAVETTFTDADISRDIVPSFGWTTPRPLDGRVENVPSVIRTNDDGEQVTSILSDAGGRADLIGRIADFRINEDGGGLAIVHSGRITQISLAQGVAAYDFHVADERWSEAADVLTSGSTTQILPSGIRTAFKNFDLAPTMDVRVVNVIDANTITVRPTGGVLVTSDVLEWLEQDLGFVIQFTKGTTPFKYTKMSAGGSDRDILGFSHTLNASIFGSLNEVAENGEPRDLEDVIISWTGHGKSLDDEITGTFIYAPNAPPTLWTPIHVGGDDGVEPFDWIKDQYDDLSIRYDSDIFDTYNVTTNPNGLIAHPRIPLIHIRATKPIKLRDQVQKICKMYGIVPFINSAGEVAPRFVTMLQDVDPSTLTDMTSAILTEPHPTWRQTSGDIVTVIQPRFSYMTPVRESDARIGRDGSVDRIKVRITDLEEQVHDRVDELGRHVLKLDLELITTENRAIFLTAQQVREIFDRYGDGPIRGSFRALSAASGVEPGDYVTISLSSYPDLANQTRGGSRVVQIMSRQVESAYTFTYLDAGPDEQPLTDPGVAIIKNATDGDHAVDVTISSLTADSTYQIQLKIGSADWVTVAEGDANEARTFGNLPSGTNIQARALESGPGRIRSEYSAAVNVTLDTLTAPNTLVVGALAGDRGTGTWVNGEASYAIEVLLDGTRVAILEAGSTSYTLTGLTPSTTYNGPGMAVRHIDRFGGVSATDTDDFTTTATATTLSAPKATLVLVGGDGV